MFRIHKISYNIDLRITAPFVFPLVVFFQLWHFKPSSVLFDQFLHVVHFRNAQRDVARSLIFVDFIGDLKTAVNLNFRNVVQIKYKISHQEDFPIPLVGKVK